MTSSFSAGKKIADSEVNKYLNRNSPFSGIWENIIHHEGDELPEETKSLINEYLHPKLKRYSMSSRLIILYTAFPNTRLQNSQPC